MNQTRPSHERTGTAVIGGGFTGLSAAYDLSRTGTDVVVLEGEPTVGGLAGAFETSGERLDRFYHHWFTNDVEVMALIEELGLSSQVVTKPTNTGVFFANKIHRLSTPMDLLRFKALPVIDRFRLGFLALRARQLKNWRSLESKSAGEWLRELGGENVYRVVWEPLLKGKFGPYAEQISAVWFWNKLKLRGSSRGKGGEERLAYLQGSFARLAESLAQSVTAAGGSIRTDCRVNEIDRLETGRWLCRGSWGTIEADRIVVTIALPLLADLIESWAPKEYLSSLRRINYLANVCLILRLKRSLSDTYWLNVNDTSFPFVGVVEHTNFESQASYGGDHVVYLSKYLPHTDHMYLMTDDEILDFAIPHLKRMFPEFDKEWIVQHHVWRARWAQPVIERNYSEMIPSHKGPWPGLYIHTMAQIYPEDRGTNYAIRAGRAAAREIISEKP